MPKLQDGSSWSWYVVFLLYLLHIRRCLQPWLLPISGGVAKDVFKLISIYSEQCVTGHRASSCQHWENVMLSRRGPSGRPPKKCTHINKPCECDAKKEKYIMVMIKSADGVLSCRPKYRCQPKEQCVLEEGRDCPPWNGSEEKSQEESKAESSGEETKLGINGVRNHKPEQTVRNMQTGFNSNGPNPARSQTYHLDPGGHASPTVSTSCCDGRVSDQAASLDHRYDMHKKRVASRTPSPNHGAIIDSRWSWNPSSTPTAPSGLKNGSVKQPRKRRQISNGSQQVFQKPQLDAGSQSGSDHGQHQSGPNMRYPIRDGNPPHFKAEHPESIGNTGELNKGQFAFTPFNSDNLRQVPDLRFWPGKQTSHTSGSCHGALHQKPPQFNRARQIGDCEQPEQLDSHHSARSSYLNLSNHNVPSAELGCQCGPTCECVLCAKHPFNARTREHMSRMSALWDEQPLDTSKSPSRADSPDGEQPPMLRMDLSQHPGFLTPAAYTNYEAWQGAKKDNDEVRHHQFGEPNQWMTPASAVATEFGSPQSLAQQRHPSMPIQNPILGYQPWQPELQGGSGDLHSDLQQQDVYQQSPHLLSEQLNRYQQLFAYPVGGCDNGACRCGANCQCLGCATHNGHILTFGDYTTFDFPHQSWNDGEG